MPTIELITNLIRVMIEAKDAGINIRQLNALLENAESKNQQVSQADIDSVISDAQRRR